MVHAASWACIDAHQFAPSGTRGLLGAVVRQQECRRVFRRETGCRSARRGPQRVDRARRKRRQRRDDRRLAAARRRRRSRLLRPDGAYQRPADPRWRGGGADSRLARRDRDPRRRVRRAGRDRLGQRAPLRRRDPARAVRRDGRRSRRRRAARRLPRAGHPLLPGDDEGPGQGHRRRLAEHDRARARRRADRAAAHRPAHGGAAVAAQVADAGGEPRGDRRRLRGRDRHRLGGPARRAACAHRCALADLWQRGRGCGRDPRRRPLRRRLSDHPGDRNARVALAGARARRRRTPAGGGRTRVGQHDHRGVLRRRALAHRHGRARSRADDGRHRACGGRRGTDRRRRRDARRSFDRHSRKERAERPVVRGGGPARRRAAARARPDVDRRLPAHHAVGGGTRRSAAKSRDRALRPVHGTVARRDRRSPRIRRRRQASRRRRECARLQALPRHRLGRLADGRARNAGHRVHRRRALAHRSGHSVIQRARPPAAARQARAQARAPRLRLPVGGPRGRRQRGGDHVRIDHRCRARGACARCRAGRAREARRAPAPRTAAA